MRRTVLFAAFMMALLVNTTSAQNLLTNPGFETYLGGFMFYPGWTSGSSDGSFSFTPGSGANAHSGANSLGLDDSVTASSTYVCSTGTISASSGETFTLSVWAKTTSFSASDGVRVALAQLDSAGTFKSFTLGAPVYPGNSGWFQISETLVATNLLTARVSAYLVFLNSGLTPSGGTVYFDDASLIRGSGALAPEMDVRGNSTSIADGDLTPSVTDHTDFGSALTAGGSVVRTFTITNSGNAVLNLNGTPKVVVSGFLSSAFTVTTQPATPVAVGGSTTFQVTFAPGGIGTMSATLSITNDDTSENPYNFVIQGTGVGPDIDVKGNSIWILDGDATPSLADHTDFGSAFVTGGTVIRTFTITNAGNAALSLTGTPKVVVGGAQSSEFTVTLQPATPVAAGGASTFQVTFDPTGVGARSATLSIDSDDSDENPYNFSVRGTGTLSGAEMDVRGNSVSILDEDATPSPADHTEFGSAFVTGGTVVRTFTITNTGDTVLNLIGTPKVVVGGAQSSEFTVTLQPVTPVAINGATTFQVTFDPAGVGLRSATLSIANDDTNENPYNFVIQGTGTIPNPVIGLSGNMAFGNVMTGTTATATMTITNSGNATLTVSGITYPSRFTGAWSGAIGAGGSHAVTVTFAPVAVTNYGGSLTVSSDATSGTSTKTVSGRGWGSTVTNAGLPWLHLLLGQ